MGPHGESLTPDRPDSESGMGFRHGLMEGDRQLIQIVDAAMAEAARRSGDWLVCRPGCTQCCIGPFAITQLDATRLREGLAELESADPQRAARVRTRAAQCVTRLKRNYARETLARVLAEDDAAEDEPCPALDPEQGTCDLYAWRPITCRTFGPPVRFGGTALAVCELCYRGATDQQIAACEVEIDPDNLEDRLLAELGVTGETIVAFALAESTPARSPASI